jgi:hypothetical protein
MQLDSSFTVAPRQPSKLVEAALLEYTEVPVHVQRRRSIMKRVPGVAVVPMRKEDKHVSWASELATDIGLAECHAEGNSFLSQGFAEGGFESENHAPHAPRVSSSVTPTQILSVHPNIHGAAHHQGFNATGMSPRNLHAPAYKNHIQLPPHAIMRNVQSSPKTEIQNFSTATTPDPQAAQAAYLGPRPMPLRQIQPAQAHSPVAGSPQSVHNRHLQITPRVLFQSPSAAKQQAPAQAYQQPGLHNQTSMVPLQLQERFPQTHGTPPFVGPQTWASPPASGSAQYAPRAQAQLFPTALPAGRDVPAVHCIEC